MQQRSAAGQSNCNIQNKIKKLIAADATLLRSRNSIFQILWQLHCHTARVVWQWQWRWPARLKKPDNTKKKLAATIVHKSKLSLIKTIKQNNSRWVYVYNSKFSWLITPLTNFTHCFFSMKGSSSRNLRNAPSFDEDALCMFLLLLPFFFFCPVLRQILLLFLRGGTWSKFCFCFF